MKAVLLSLVLLGLLIGAFATTEAQYRSMFNSWKQKYHKTYQSSEHEARYVSWKNNHFYVHQHNSMPHHSFKVELNAFADMTIQEFSSIYNGFRGNYTAKNVKNIIKRAPRANPTSVDWVTAGAVTPIKNQGQCGSCWSFSATGSMEGNRWQDTQQLIGLSEQNLVDCSTAEGNDGCNGGLMDQAFEYVIKNGGIDSEASYPYTATGPNACKYKTANSAATLKSYQDVPSGSEVDLENFVVQQPVSVAIDASHNSFQLYKSGVYYEPACSSTQLDHGVLAVGYGVSGTTPYWLVKNSWGTSWGMAGYIWMSKDRNNNCGIATSASVPLQTEGPMAASTTTSGPSTSGPPSSSSGPSGSSSSGNSSSASSASSGSSSGSSSASSSASSGSSSASSSASSGSSSASSGSSSASSGSSSASSGTSGNSGGSSGNVFKNIRKSQKSQKSHKFQKNADARKLKHHKKH